MRLSSDKVEVNFLLGPGRSGTTLLMLMLNEHPNVLAAPELKHLLYFYERYKNINKVTLEFKNEIALYFNELRKAGRFGKPFVFHSQELLDSLIPGEKTDFGTVMKQAYLSFEYNKAVTEVKVLIDKNPFYTLHWKKLLKVYPESRFILMNRDPRGYVSSNFFSTDIFTKKRSIYYYALVWRFYAKKVDEILKQENARTLFFTYEKMIMNPLDVIGKIYSFLNLSSETELALNYSKTVSEKLASVDLDKLEPRIRKKLLDLARPVYTESLNTWKSKLSESQIKACDFICGKYAKRFGYQPMYQITVKDKLTIFVKSIPALLRVWLAFTLKSVKLEHYLKVKKRIKKSDNQK